jgi:phosphoglycerol transferase MdoB-like AlkP superfamily enzyme
MSSYFLHLKLLLKKIGIAFLIFSLCRILFYIFNGNHFADVPIKLFFYGIRFDFVAISFLFSPLILLHLIPFPFRNFKWYSKLLALSFYIPNTIIIILNLIDLAYFDFTLKRTTFDFFGMITTGNDFVHLLPHYIIDFWYDYILLIGLLVLSWFLHKKFCKSNFKFYPYGKKDYLIHSAIFAAFLGLTIIGMRGGLQYRPIDIINAGQYAQAQNIPIVLNTPFTIIKTTFVDKMEPVSYYSDNILENIYTPEKTIIENGRFKGKNIVFIILESFAKEYVGGYNNGEGYTPFIDSLLKESYVFTNAYANGNRSIESLPCILTGIPQLMNASYTLSNYTGNELDGLPKLLKKEGYNTSFYHGGENGTMGFNGFVGIAGIDDYYGLDEYPNKEVDFDGLWGIFDRPYLQYFASELNQKKQPFFSTIFTLSSHHPYTIPKENIGMFPKGTLPFHESIGYTDYSLQQFFNTAQKMTWFSNTIFVFTADHSSLSNSAKYKTRLGQYAIPMFIFDPSGEFKGVNNNYFQQIDIPPTIMSLTGISDSVITFGNNAFGKEEKFVINYINSSYQIAYQDYFLIFDGEKTTDFFDIKQDSLFVNNLINKLNLKQNNIKNNTEQFLKAIIQQYNYRVINNKLSINK